MTSFLFLADGFEEIEALATVDLLRRAGLDLKTVSINPTRTATGAHGVEVTADVTFAEANFAEVGWLILPGGMPGAQNLHDYEPLAQLLRKHAAHNGNIAAICASPAVVLANLGLLDGREATCYPGFEHTLTAHGAVHRQQPVVHAGNIVTANGPASAMLFALAIIADTLGRDAAAEVSKGLLYFPTQAPTYF